MEPEKNKESNVAQEPTNAETLEQSSEKMRETAKGAMLDVIRHVNDLVGTIPEEECSSERQQNVISGGIFGKIRDNIFFTNDFLNEISKEMKRLDKYK